MKQKKIESIIEAGINTLMGMVIATVITQLAQGPLGYDMPIMSNVGLTTVITIASVLRSYCVRRFFANDLHRVVHEFVTKQHLGEEDDDDSEGT